MQVKLNKTFVANVEHPASGQVFYRDTALPGFALRVTAGSKTYVVEKWIKKLGKSCRYTIGKHPSISAEFARREAERILHELAGGVHLNEQKRTEKEKEEQSERAKVTLSQVYDSYVNAKSPRPSTIKVYGIALRICFPDWLDLPITQISEDAVQERYEELITRVGPRSDKGGAKAHANQSMRVLRRLMNYAMIKFKNENGEALLSKNPVHRLKEADLWTKVPPRKSFIKEHEMPKWYKAVIKLQNATIRDFLLLCLFTGLRRNEAAQLRWDDIDMVGKTLRIPPERTKNGEEHVLPLSDYLCQLLDRRIRQIGNPYVFPGTGSTGHLVEMKRVIDKVTNDCGVKFKTHDLRRTFITIAQRTDVPFLVSKKLLNHKIDDMTAEYTQITEEDLREPMQRITDKILEFAKKEVVDSTKEAEVHDVG